MPEPTESTAYTLPKPAVVLAEINRLQQRIRDARQMYKLSCRFHGEAESAPAEETSSPGAADG
jgi:hypothetical protein